MARTYVKRKLAATIRRALKTFPVVIVTGPRQSGKTTLLRREFGRRFRYVSLEDPDVRAISRSDPRAFLTTHPPPAILDEIQHAPDLLSYVKTAVDDDRRPGQWILTGSQHFPLMAGVTQSLAGRAAMLSLYGLAAAEIPGSRRLSTAAELLRGSFPEPRLSDPRGLRLWMARYLRTYVERDIRLLVQVGDLASFEQFVRLCAARTAQTLSLADLARDAAVSATTARRWLSILETSGQFVRLEPYARSRTKRMVKSPKLFATDTGLAAYLTGHRDKELLWNGPMKGALFETAVFAELSKHFHNEGDVPSVCHWRASDGLEVDFVVEVAGTLHGLEARANATPVPRMADSLLTWRKLLGREAGRTALVCDCADRHTIAPSVEAIPWRRLDEYCREIVAR